MEWQWPGRQQVSFPPIPTSVCCTWTSTPFRRLVQAFFLAQLWRWQKSLRTQAELVRARLYHVCVCLLGRAEPSSGCRLSQALADPPYGFDRLRDVCVGWLGRPEPSSGSRLSQALADPPFGITTNYGMSALVGWIVLSQALDFAWAKP